MQKELTKPVSFRVDPSTGAFINVTGSPFPIVPDGSGIAADPMRRFVFMAGTRTKLMDIGSCLGAIRNAADHGAADPDIPGTTFANPGCDWCGICVCGLFIVAATFGYEQHAPPEI
jgi:hypothetical protein